MKFLTSLILSSLVLATLAVGDRADARLSRSQQVVAAQPQVSARRGANVRNSLYRGSGRRVIMAARPGRLPV